MRHRPWRRFVAFGCSHGGHLNQEAFDQMMAFVRDFKPHARIHLGDNWDQAAFRCGSAGTVDEGADIGADIQSGIDVLDQFEPTAFFLGNHEHRPYRDLHHPRAIIRAAAQLACGAIERICKRHKCEVIPYDIEAGWRLLGDTLFGHGYMFNEMAVRDHVEMLGHPVAIAHLHRQIQQPGRARGAPVGRCVGCMGDLPAMGYARTRRATTAWTVGYSKGEYQEGGQCHLDLVEVRQSGRAELKTFART